MWTVFLLVLSFWLQILILFTWAVVQGTSSACISTTSSACLNIDLSRDFSIHLSIEPSSVTSDEWRIGWSENTKKEATIKRQHFHQRHRYGMWQKSSNCIDNIVIILYCGLPTRLVFWYSWSSSYLWHWHLLALAFLQNF